MKNVKLLWIEDDANFGPSIHYRIEDELQQNNIILDEPEILQNGNYVWDTVRDLKPDIIMMDHNLQDVRVNGANLIIEIRFQNNETPIIFYSSEMGPTLMNLVNGEHKVFTTTRADVHSELMRLVISEFATEK